MPEKGQGLIEYALIIVLIAVVVIVVGAVIFDGATTPPETQLQTYTRLYNECLAEETISAERCHDIAVEQVYE